MADIPSSWLPGAPQIKPSVALPGSQGNVANPPPLPGFGADGKPIPQNPNLLPPPIGGYVAAIAHSFIVANPNSIWDVDVYYTAAKKFVLKVIADNGAPECWAILEKISGFSKVDSLNPKTV